MPFNLLRSQQITSIPQPPFISKPTFQRTGTINSRTSAAEGVGSGQSNIRTLCYQKIVESFLNRFSKLIQNTTVHR
jgi:hypothetical protein